MALTLRWWAGLGLVCGASAATQLFAGCSTTPSGNPDATPDVTVGCYSNLTSCSNQCVDLTADPSNCGMCGHACGTGQTCIKSTCVQTCGGGSAYCGDACVDLLGDPNNCGMCNMTCPSGNVCNDGGCSLSCQQGYNMCPNDAGVTVCINPMDNDFNCGGCVAEGGVVCGPGTRCEGGTCNITCQNGLTACQETAADGSTYNACANLLVDNNNCGSCGSACDAGLYCSPTDDAGDAACGLGCFGGSLLCENRCIDPFVDPYNCGSCNFVCDGGSPQCVNGKCQ